MLGNKDQRTEKFRPCCWKISLIEVNLGPDQSKYDHPAEKTLFPMTGEAEPGVPPVGGTSHAHDF